MKLTALREPSWAFVLACRDISKGRDAVEKLRGEGITAELGVVELDVENDEHIEKAVKSVGDKYGKLDGEYMSSRVESYTGLLTSR